MAIGGNGRVDFLVNSPLLPTESSIRLGLESFLGLESSILNGAATDPGSLSMGRSSERHCIKSQCQKSMSNKGNFGGNASSPLSFLFSQ
jgi:hypothetical protein